MRIAGFAYTSNEAKESARRSKIRRKISHLRKEEHIKSKFNAKYGRNCYSGELLSEEAKRLSEEELAYLILGGCCFGGQMTITGNKFEGYAFND